MYLVEDVNNIVLPRCYLYKNHNKHKKSYVQIKMVYSMLTYCSMIDNELWHLELYSRSCRSCFLQWHRFTLHYLSCHLNPSTTTSWFRLIRLWSSVRISSSLLFYEPSGLRATRVLVISLSFIWDRLCLRRMRDAIAQNDNIFEILFRT